MKWLDIKYPISEKIIEYLKSKERFPGEHKIWLNNIRDLRFRALSLLGEEKDQSVKHIILRSELGDIINCFCIINQEMERNLLINLPGIFDIKIKL